VAEEEVPDVTLVEVVVATVEDTPVVEDHLREAMVEVVVVDAEVEENPARPETIVPLSL
jgi:hypothetical protein